MVFPALVLQDGFFSKPCVWQGLGAEVKHREELLTFLFFLLYLKA